MVYYYEPISEEKSSLSSKCGAEESFKKNAINSILLEIYDSLAPNCLTLLLKAVMLPPI